MAGCSLSRDNVTRLLELHIWIHPIHRQMFRLTDHQWSVPDVKSCSCQRARLAMTVLKHAAASILSHCPGFMQDIWFPGFVRRHMCRASSEKQPYGGEARSPLELCSSWNASFDPSLTHLTSIAWQLKITGLLNISFILSDSLLFKEHFHCAGSLLSSSKSPLTQAANTFRENYTF